MITRRTILGLAACAAAALHISKHAFDGPNSFTCNKYVANTFIYLVLAIALTSTMVIMLEERHYRVSFDTWLPAILVGIGCLIGASVMSTDKMALKHALWIIFLGTMAVSLYPVVQNMKDQDTFRQAALTTILLVVGIAYYVQQHPTKDVSKGWGPKLFMGLLAMMLFYVVCLFTGNVEATRGRGISAAMIAFFSAYLLHDSEKVYAVAKGCGTTTKPDYIRDSLHLYLDAINIFVRSDRLVT